MWTINNLSAYWVNFGNIILRTDEVVSVTKQKQGLEIWIMFKNGKTNKLHFETVDERDKAFTNMWEMITRK